MGVSVILHADESPIAKAPWRPDGASDSCLCCGKDFSIWTRRRHHCRACGELVCGDCSPFSAAFPQLGYKEPVRVCTKCSKAEVVASAASTLVFDSGESDSESSDFDEDELVAMAVDVIALHSMDKHSKLSYQYFHQSEAVSWIFDAGLLKNRSACTALFQRVVEEDYVTLKPSLSGGSKRSAVYLLNDELCTGQRLSHYGSAMHSETSKCSNCAQSFLASLTPAPGFCSIDCKTNALISSADSARIRKYYS